MACGYAFHPRAIGDPRGRVAVRASSIAAARSILLRSPTSVRGHCALCAPTVFFVRIKGIRTKNTVLDKNDTRQSPSTLFHVEQRLTV
jgi:hypothetical protein